MSTDPKMYSSILISNVLFRFQTFPHCCFKILLLEHKVFLFWIWKTCPHTNTIKHFHIILFSDKTHIPPFPLKNNSILVQSKELGVWGGESRRKKGAKGQLLSSLFWRYCIFFYLLTFVSQWSQQFTFLKTSQPFRLKACVNIPRFYFESTTVVT